MADRLRVRVLRVVGVAYGDLARVLQAMPRLVAIVVLIVLVRALVEQILPDGATVVGQLAGLALGAVEAFLLTPFFIAVHRFIILDEMTRRYVLDANDPRFFRFFVWSLTFTVIGTSMALLQNVMQAVRLPVHIMIVVDVAVGVVVSIIGLRLTVLFPAIAVDARGATASNAFADTRGNAFRIFVTFAVAYLPLVALGFALTPWGPGGARALPPVAHVILSVLYAAALPLFIAIASRIFQALADQVVGRPTAGVAPT